MKRICLLLMVLLLIGCQSSEVVTLNIEEQFDDQVILGINSFGQNMLQKIYEDDSENNIVFSPLSCTTALAMLENGASGESKEEIREVLGVNLNALMNETYYSLNEHFNDISNNEEMPITILSNNSLWYNKHMKIDSDYESVMKNYFNAEVTDVNFSKASAKDDMNQWVEDKTNGMIKDIVSSTKETDVLYLINTLYFNGKWDNSFTRSQTEKKPFYLSSGEEITVDMMWQEDHFNYYNHADFQMIQLGYGRASMYVVLPKDNMDQFLSKYEDFQVSSYKEDMKYDNVEFSMPKYEIKNKLDLIPFLKALGLEAVFNYDTAELDRMIQSDDELAVSKVIQSARIIVDEKGTEAAAATAVTVDTTAMPVENEPNVMICDRPFMFVIKDNNTQTDLFIGIIQNPNKQ